MKKIIKGTLLMLTAVILFGASLQVGVQAEDEGTLPMEATVPTTQSTVGMDEEEGSDEELSWLTDQRNADEECVVDEETREVTGGGDE